MIINQPGAEFFYENICYKIGDRIVGTDASEYQGLLGSIIEIRDGEDKETENETPDIYCFINVKRRLRILFWMKSLWRRK